jgi:hypothetical protein
MDVKTDFDDLREQRVELFHMRLLDSLRRKDASAGKIRETLSITQDSRLPRVALEFRINEYSDDPCRWPLVDGFAKAMENYVISLRGMERVRRSNSSWKGLTSQHRAAFDAVVASARVLQDLGWPVNWEQNVQAILETTEYGLRNGKLVHRFESLPERVTLGEETVLLGAAAFYRQTTKNGKVGYFKAVPLTALTKSRYDEVELHLRHDDDQVPERFRYCSDWLAGGLVRIAI